MRTPSIIVTVCSFLLSLLFVGMGAATKLAGAQFQRETFDHYGYPVWMMYLVGVAELFCGGMILFSRTRFAAALMMICITVGVVLSMAHVGEFSWQALGSPAVITMAVAGFVAWASRPRTSRFNDVLERETEN